MPFSQIKALSVPALANTYKAYLYVCACLLAITFDPEKE